MQLKQQQHCLRVRVAASRAIPCRSTPTCLFMQYRFQFLVPHKVRCEVFSCCLTNFDMESHVASQVYSKLCRFSPSLSILIMQPMWPAVAKAKQSINQLASYEKERERQHERESGVRGGGSYNKGQKRLVIGSRSHKNVAQPICRLLFDCGCCIYCCCCCCCCMQFSCANQLSVLFFFFFLPTISQPTFPHRSETKR